MKDPALLMLLERLLWPVPRVRWEAARSLAGLIREENGEAISGLLGWLKGRRLESEALLALGVIDAFDLGRHFEFEDVASAIKAPSHLSDLILKSNFPTARGLSRFRYKISPAEDAFLPNAVGVLFDRYRNTGIPPIFSHFLRRLDRETNFSFTDRWRHDWRRLQATHRRPAPQFPGFFAASDRFRRGHFQCGQGELLISAYLRTLAYASIRGYIPHAVAEDNARLAFALNRRLADLEPIERPDWTRNLLPCTKMDARKLALALWAHADNTSEPDEAPIALRVVDTDANDFVEFDITLAIGPAGFSTGPAQAQSPNLVVASEHPGEMAGMVGEDAIISPISVTSPRTMIQGVAPYDLGYIHTETALNIRLASPEVFQTSASVECDRSEIRLESKESVLSRWYHWYADWEPTTSLGLDTAICSLTIVDKGALEGFLASRGLEHARLVKIRRGERSDTFREPAVDSHSYWA